MKKYKIPSRMEEIVISEGQIPMGIIKVLQKDSNNEWTIVEKVIPLEEVND